MTQTDKPTELPETEAGAPALDTEGHSLLNAEFANTVVRDRQRDAERNARDEARRRELKKPSRSLRDRLLGR
jgi:hypothetical protein